jgi:single-strand DNA-binding protein
LAKSLNRTTLLGYVGKDPEIRTTGGGTMVANFSLATTERVKESEQWAERTEWHALIAFGRLAEVIRDYVTKGSKLYVEGKLQTRSWEDKNSREKKYKTEVVVIEMILMDRKEPGEPPRKVSNPVQPEVQPQSDDDIPF